MPVEISEETARALAEAADFVMEEVASGRSYGFDSDATRENAEELSAAREELGATLDDAVGRDDQ